MECSGRGKLGLCLLRGLTARERNLNATQEAVRPLKDFEPEWGTRQNCV